MSPARAFLTLAAALAVFTPAARGAGPSAADVQDVVFFYETRPVFLRLHIEVDGKPFQTHWSDTIRRLHRYLDADGDGVLSAKERAPWLQRLAAPNRGRMNQNNAPAAQGRPVDSIATAADLTEYLRPVFGPFQFQVAPRTDATVEALFSLLDLDENRTLSADELKAADTTLLKFDQDEDGTLTAAELLPYQNPFMARRRLNAEQQQNQGNSAPPAFLAIGPHEPRAQLARRLLTQYDKAGGPDDGPGKDNKLQAAEIGLDPESFAAADQDGDGTLDSDELVHALASPPPTLELDVKIIRRVPSIFSTLKAVETPGRPSPLASAVRKGTGNGLVIALESDLIEVNLPPANGNNVREIYRQQFMAADGDNNKYLDKKEAQQNGVFGNQQFDLMDRDGDGKLFEKEMDDFIGRQVEAADSRTVLSVADQGRSLFQVLDLNRDSRLSARELRAAVKKIALWDRDHDGGISAEEIPRHYRLAFGAGTSPLLLDFGGQVNTFEVNMGLTGPGASGGPEWFRRMDLNRDGDVSAPEFLGTRDQFRKLDADSDGLIDPAEAAKAR